MPKNKALSMPFIENKLNLTESFKAQVDAKLVQFPKELGVEHPFNFEIAEKAFRKYGFVKAAVDKHLDFFISQDFNVKSRDIARPCSNPF